MKITTMLDIACFSLVLLASACFYDFLALEKWFYLVFLFVFVGLSILIQIGKRKFN